MPKLPSVSGQEIIRALERLGFIVASQRGSHVKYGDGVHVVIVVAGRKQIRAGTMSSIARQAGLSLADFDI